MQAFSWVRRLLKSERGNVVVLGASVLPMVVGAAALGVDTIQLSLWKRQLQRAADSAALAGGQALSQSKDVTAAVDRDLAFNNQVPLLAGRLVEPPPASGPFTNDTRAVRVVITSKQSLPFWSFFTGASPTLTAEATARIVPEGTFCMFTKEDGNVTGIDISGNAEINLGCGMATNSRAAQAVTAGGSSMVTATPITAVGGLTASSNFRSPTQLIAYSAPLTDPYETLPNPTVPSSCRSLEVKPNDPATTITEGCYSNMDIKGTVTLADGTYIIDGGSFNASAQANITCNACTIILTSSTAATNPASVATLNINAGAQLNMTAPGTGTYAGILIYQDRRATLLNDIHINGHASGKFQGAIYLPQANVRMNGSSGMNTQCLQFITRRLTFRGSASIQNNCPTNSGVRQMMANYVRLVG